MSPPRSNQPAPFVAPAAPFATLGVSPALVAVLDRMGLTTPTPIQTLVLPPLLSGRDVLAQSNTGSGKTVAFAVPLLQRLGPSRVLQAMILCPTRELCAQVARVVRTVGGGIPGLRVLILAGGEPGGPQRRSLELGTHVVVGTPGRVLDHLDRGALDLRTLQMVVLDEADRMLDMGFAPQVERLLEAAPKRRQSVFCSATVPAEFAAMSLRWLQDPVHVSAATAPPDIEVRAYETNDKPAALLRLLREANPTSALVFCNFKADVETIVAGLTEAGVHSAGLQGDLEQFERDRVVAQFRNGSVRVLVATDVASRGMDIVGLDLVIQYDLPAQTDGFVHRIGRTGRAGQAGCAAVLLGPKDGGRLRRIEEERGAIPRVDLPNPAPIALPAPNVTLKISGGRGEKLRAGDVLGALTGEAGLPASAIGSIAIHDHYTYVAVASAVAGEAHAQLASGRIKGRHFRVDRIR